MTMSSALNAGVAGLNANASRLASISDNISNSGTYGYKRASTEFEALVMTELQNSGGYAAGGVRASAMRLIDERGSLVSTSNALDLAVSGRGMLPVARSIDVTPGQSPNTMLMTTTGAFRTDSDGVLRTASGLVLLGWPANTDGTVPVTSRDTYSDLQPVVVNASQQLGDPTTKMKLGVNLPASGTEVGATGDSLPLSVEYFGNLGSSETLDFTFTPTVGTTGPTNEWTMTITDSSQGGAIVGEYVLLFDNSRDAGGTLLSVTTTSGGSYDADTGDISLAVGGGPLSLNIGKIGESGGLTQLSGSFASTSVTKNGSPVGNLTSVEVDERGMVVATYDTGFTRSLFQIPLVDVPNPNGLIALDNQTYEVSPDSGNFFLWDAGSGPTGAVKGYSREGSTTDVATELTNLIQTQRAYSSNAKVIQTVDEMLQETTNIKR